MMIKYYLEYLYYLGYLYYLCYLYVVYYLYYLYYLYDLYRLQYWYYLYHCYFYVSDILFYYLYYANNMYYYQKHFHGNISIQLENMHIYMQENNHGFIEKITIYLRNMYSVCKIFLFPWEIYLLPCETSLFSCDIHINIRNNNHLYENVFIAYDEIYLFLCEKHPFS